VRASGTPFPLQKGPLLFRLQPLVRNQNVGEGEGEGEGESIALGRPRREKRREEEEEGKWNQSGYGAIQRGGILAGVAIDMSRREQREGEYY